MDSQQMIQSPAGSIHVSVWVILDEIVGQTPSRCLDNSSTCLYRPHSAGSLQALGAKVVLLEGNTYWDYGSNAVAEAAAFCRAYLEVLFDHDIGFKDWQVYDLLQIFRVAKRWRLVDFMGCAKYCSVYPLARYMQRRNKENTLPNTPTGFLGTPTFGSSIGRYLKARLVTGTKKALRLMVSIQQGVKRGCKPASAEQVCKSMLDHKAILSQPPTGGPALHRPFYEELFENFVFRPPPKLGEASTSASFDATVKDGGARYYIQDLLLENGDKELLRMAEYAAGRVHAFYGIPAPRLVDILHMTSFPDNLRAIVSAILEPLKVRLITKGDSVAYWIARDLQKALWRHLYSFRQFSLIGEPLNKSHLHEIMAQEDALGVHFTDWVSGDFSAATDRLDLRQTLEAHGAAMRCIFGPGGPPSALREVYDLVIGAHEISYPKDMVAMAEKIGRDLSPFKQRNGQLMGSNLSFPYLCTINLACYSRALERRLGHRVPIHLLPVKINGDDVVFRADSELYSIWKEEISAVGFKLSDGKNFIDSNMVTVNSRYYYWTKDQDLIEDIPFLNVGLLTGNSKVMREKDFAYRPLADIHRECMSGAVDPVRANKRFIHYNKRLIREMTQDGLFNLYAVAELGGSGLDLPVGATNTFTNFQRRWGAFCDTFGYDVVPPGVKFHVEGSPKGQCLEVMPRVPTDDASRAPLYGPLPAGVVRIQPRVFRAPPLAIPYPRGDKCRSFKVPSQSVHRSFKEQLEAHRLRLLSDDELMTRKGPWVRCDGVVLSNVQNAIEAAKGLDPVVPTDCTDVDRALFRSHPVLEALHCFFDSSVAEKSGRSDSAHL